MKLKNVNFRSSLKPYMIDFINFKRQQNLKAETTGKRLRLFDNFLYEQASKTFFFKTD